MGPQNKTACHPASFCREAALNGEADWAVAAAWTQEAALPARTGVGEDGRRGQRRLSLKGTRPRQEKVPAATPMALSSCQGVTLRPGFLRNRPETQPLLLPGKRLT